MKATFVDVSRSASPWRASLPTAGNARLQVTSHLRLEGDLVAEDLLVEGAAWSGLVEALRSSPSLREVLLLESGPRHARVRVVAAECPLSRAIARSRRAPLLPWKVLPHGERLLFVGDDPRPFLEAAAEEGLDPRIARIQDFRPTSLLTPRQEEILDAALSAGYWDLPRGATLVALARSLDVTPASLTYTLAVIEKRILASRAGAPGRMDADEEPPEAALENPAAPSAAKGARRRSGGKGKPPASGKRGPRRAGAGSSSDPP